MRILILLAALAVVLEPPRAHAVLIGFFPGLDALIEKSDAIVVLRIDGHASGFGSSTLYSTHDCFIYQTLKGDIPAEKTLRLQLMDTRTQHVTPFAFGSTHLMFLIKKRSANEPTDYRTISFRGANVQVSPFGQEQLPAGKTTREQITSLLKSAEAYQQKQQAREQAFLNLLIQGAPEPPDAATAP